MKKLNPIEREIRFQELDDHTQDCLLAIVAEMQRAETRHPHWPIKKARTEWDQDFVYASAIVTEEVGELVKACIQFQYEGRRYSEIETEAIQTGAMALRFLKNLPEDKSE